MHHQSCSIRVCLSLRLHWGLRRAVTGWDAMTDCSLDEICSGLHDVLGSCNGKYLPADVLELRHKLGREAAEGWIGRKKDEA